jgi:diguanylate cyclase (GGDEF)-like protein
MSLVVARQKRTHLFASIAGLLLIVGLVSLISVEDPGGATLRIGIIMVALGAGLWMQRSWELIPITLLAWLVPNFGRSLMDDTYELFQVPMMLEAAGALAVAGVATVAREALKELETESMLIGSNGEGTLALTSETRVFGANQLRPSLEAELARSRRFGRTFSLVLVGIDEMRQKYDYRDPGAWEASLDATARLLRNTRQNVDRVFHYGEGGFAMILPESSEKDVVGMVRRLRRLARVASPAEGEPGGPLPAHYGATFFPTRATTVEDLFRRAEIALKIAEKSTSRYQLDSAEAPELPPAETLRRPPEVVAVDLTAGEPTEEWVPIIDETAGEDLEPVALIDEDVEIFAAELTIAEGEDAQADEGLVETLQPVLAFNAQPSVQRNIESFDDIEALLQQMDETLSMIRSVRAKAA